MKCPECGSEAITETEPATSSLPAEYECDDCGEIFEDEDEK